MLSNRPYLMRAFYQWIVDSNCTPILVIDANHPRCNIPKEFAEDGEIVFNISPAAVKDLKISNNSVDFKASFSGVVHLITAPTKSILSLYAEENGEGIFFDPEEDDGTEADVSVVQLKSIEGSITSSIEQTISVQETPRNKPFLTLVE